MRLTAAEQRLLDELISTAKPLSGAFFRSVEFRWMHPDDVISGEGTAKLGGRFAPVGTRAVYASDSEETVLAELRYRKERLGGKSQITLAGYPRIMFRLDIKLRRCLDFTAPLRSAQLEQLRVACLAPAELVASQLVGAYALKSAIQGILFPSVAGGGSNVTVFRDNIRPGNLILHNRAELLAEIARLSRRRTRR